MIHSVYQISGKQIENGEQAQLFHHLIDFVLNRTSSIEVSPGFVTDILVTPSLHCMEPMAEGVSEEKRDCRLNWKNGGHNLTKYYSQSGCTFECGLREATKYCGCVAWDYPQLGSENVHRVCDYFGKLCFEDTMSKTHKKCQNICLQECYSHR